MRSFLLQVQQKDVTVYASQNAPRTLCALWRGSRVGRRANLRAQPETRQHQALRVQTVRRIFPTEPAVCRAREGS